MHLQPNHLLKYLEKHWPPINQLEKEERTKYAGTIEFVHRYENGGKYSHNVHKNCACLTVKKLRERYGRGVFQQILDNIGGIKRKGFQKGAFTYGYYLSDELRKVVRGFDLRMRDNDPPKGEIVDKKGNKVRSKPNAIYDEDMCGNKAKTNAWLPPTIEINARETYKQYARFHDMVIDCKQSQGQCPEEIKNKRDKYHRLFEWAHTESNPTGQMIQRYNEVKSGRIYGFGACIQGASEEVRKNVLSGTGYVEYDMSNAHYSIFYDMAKEQNVDCPGIKHYLENKDTVRDKLTKAVFGKELEQNTVTFKEARGGVKGALLAKINGASDNDRVWDDENGRLKKGGIAEALAVNKNVDGTSQKRRLSQIELYNDVTAEIEEVQKAVITYTKDRSKKDGFHINKMGKQISNKKSRSKILSHILQGAEAKVLNVILEELEGRVLVPRHDGFISKEPINTTRLEEEILEQTGFDLEIEEENRF